MKMTQQEHDEFAGLSVEERLGRGAELLNACLQQATALGDLDRKLVTYYSLATHALPSVNRFPLLNLFGKMGTGKSEAEKIAARFAHHPRSFNLRGMTLPALRDELANCNEGTAIIEEGDQAWRDGEMAFERLLSDRYQRDSANAGVKQKIGDQGWTTKSHKYFGATILHRRMPFNDAAIDGRGVTVHFRANHDRKYVKYSDDDPLIIEGSGLVQHLTFELPVVDQLCGVAARIFDSHEFLIAVATLCGDECFADQLGDRLQVQTAELKEAQSAEPDGLVLRAILEKVQEDHRTYKNINISNLVQSIWENQRTTLQPRQVAGLARQLGFDTKNSHGVTCIAPTPVSLLAACMECGYEDDEAVLELKKKVLRRTEWKFG
jgi:hypothetical protein